jgi:hypothetical protein
MRQQLSAPRKALLDTAPSRGHDGGRQEIIRPRTRMPNSGAGHRSLRLLVVINRLRANDLKGKAENIVCARFPSDEPRRPPPQLSLEPPANGGERRQNKEIILPHQPMGNGPLQAAPLFIERPSHSDELWDSQRILLRGGSVEDAALLTMLFFVERPGDKGDLCRVEQKLFYFIPQRS